MLKKLLVLSILALSISAAAAPKTYAVFMATWDPETKQAVGGVAGSAFFVSPTKAITAFHVLQPKSFENTRTQIWLVHEGEPAIEVTANELHADSANDRTTIELKKTTVPRRHVFAVGPFKTGDRVETEGFHANSAGPVLEISGNRLRITSVPRLERLRAEGQVLRGVRVELNAQDVRLKNTPCVQLSYTPVLGLSGGPVISGSRVIAMNSFADPHSRASTWAVSNLKE